MTTIYQHHISAADATASRPLSGAHALIWLVTLFAMAGFETYRIHRGRTEATVRDQGSHRVFLIALGLITAVLLATPKAAPGAGIRPDSTAFAVGEAMFLAGFALRGWAILTLGRYFTGTVMTSPEQPVITSGPYRLLRHPSYTGLLLYSIGIGFIWDNWIGLAVVALLALIPTVYRIRVEERALLEDLGEPYRSFAQGRKRLVPFIW